MNKMYSHLLASGKRGGAPRAAMLCIAALTVAAAALAAPAPWYLWRSKLNGELYCAQTSPGQGWTLSDGPFKDLACLQRGRPGR